MRSQNAISKEGRGGRRYLPYAFTEHGAIMVVTVLNSPLAVEASIIVVREFVRLREMFYENSELRRRLQGLEARLAKGFEAHEHELREIRFLITELQRPTERNKRRLGF